MYMFKSTIYMFKSTIDHNNIPNFEALIRKSIFAFKTRLSKSDNTIIFALQSSRVITDTIWKVWKDMLYVET